MNPVMLDTNAYSALLSGNVDVRDVLSTASEILVSPFVIGELEAGFKNGRRYEDNRNILKRFLEKPGVREVAAGHETGMLYGKIKNDLMQMGKPIPANDIWIAASAIENGAVLITYDKHFAAVKTLKRWPATA